jgi:hypothetical protein
MPAASAPSHPAAQIAPALLTLARDADGSRQMTLRLHPAELGAVQVRIGRSETGTARIDIFAEQTGTLQALIRDQAELHRALDDAGVPAAGRTIVFHAAPASAPSEQSGFSFQAAHQGGSGTPNGHAAFGGGRSGYADSGHGSDPGSSRNRTPAGKTEPPRSESYRVGLDIVA